MEASSSNYLISERIDNAIINTLSAPYYALCAKIPSLCLESDVGRVVRNGTALLVFWGGVISLLICAAPNANHHNLQIWGEVAGCTLGVYLLAGVFFNNFGSNIVKEGRIKNLEALLAHYARTAATDRMIKELTRSTGKPDIITDYRSWLVTKQDTEIERLGKIPLGSEEFATLNDFESICAKVLRYNTFITETQHQIAALKGISLDQVQNETGIHPHPKLRDIANLVDKPNPNPIQS